MYLLLYTKTNNPMSLSVFWCDKRLFRDIIQKFGSNCKSYSVECIGNHHLKVTVDGEFDTLGAQRYCSINWDNTRWMLMRKGFEAYLMLDIDGLLKFIGKKGIGIRK